MELWLQRRQKIVFQAITVMVFANVPPAEVRSLFNSVNLAFTSQHHNSNATHSTQLSVQCLLFELAIHICFSYFFSCSLNNTMPIISTPRLPSSRQSFIALKVTGMNLRGTGQYDGFLWTKKEIFNTDFLMTVFFRHFSWTVQKDFEACKDLLLQVFPSKRQLYEDTFPKIHDINDDVMALISRKEAMEEFLTEIVTTMDFLLYQPLQQFLCPHSELAPLLEKVIRIQAFTRQFLVHSAMEEVLLFNCMSKIE